jgi:hypothetical protein
LASAWLSFCCAAACVTIAAAVAALSESAALVSATRREMRRQLFVIDSHQPDVIGTASSAAVVAEELPLHLCAYSVKT